MTIFFTWDNWPQYLIGAMLLLGVLFNLAQEGKPKTGKHSVGGAAFGALFWIWVLHSGGFW